jgi:hypothetical protein
MQGCQRGKADTGLLQVSIFSRQDLLEQPKITKVHKRTQTID